MVPEPRGRTMKNQYVGDQRDFVKYGLLREIRRAGMSVGVCWMLTPDDGGRDGNHTGYLLKPAYRACDAELFDTMPHLRQARHVGDVRARALVADAAYYEEIVPPGREARRRWWEAGHAAMGRARLMFFDPDNGLITGSVSAGGRSAVKYALDEEIREAVAAGRSVLIYQHWPRVERNTFCGRVRERLSALHPQCAVCCLCTSGVLFAAMIQPQDAECWKTVERALAERWRGVITCWNGATA